MKNMIITLYNKLIYKFNVLHNQTQTSFVCRYKNSYIVANVNKTCNVYSIPPCLDRGVELDVKTLKSMYKLLLILSLHQVTQLSLWSISTN